MTRFPHTRRTAGVTLMEMIVVLAVIIILAAIVVPVYSAWKSSANKAVALANMRSLAEACMTFTSQNDGMLPGEDAAGPNTWGAAANPENANVWYNALPRLLGGQGTGDYAGNPKGFYMKDNILFLPGAGYQDSEAKYTRPQFAIAMNSRLQRKTEDTKDKLRIGQIQEPSRTVLFYEQGVSGEKKTSGLQSKFDGAPKGTARSLAGRYGGRGIVTFVDGHCELYEPRDLLTGTGTLPFPQTEVIWTPNPLDNPN